MAARTDLLLDANGDLPIGATLMTVGPSDVQHQKDCLSAVPGSWKQFIFNGVGISRYLKATGNNIAVLKNNARQQLQRDGYNVSKMDAYYDTENKLVIVTNATR